MSIERETYQKSRIGFDLLYKELQKKYENECLSKQVRILLVDLSERNNGWIL